MALRSTRPLNQTSLGARLCGKSSAETILYAQSQSAHHLARLSLLVARQRPITPDMYPGGSGNNNKNRAGNDKSEAPGPGPSYSSVQAPVPFSQNSAPPPFQTGYDAPQASQIGQQQTAPPGDQIVQEQQQLGYTSNQPEQLRTSNYDPISHDLDQSRQPQTMTGSTTSPVIGMSLPFPPQARINDFDSMFNRRNDPMNSTLPIPPDEEFDGSAFGFTSGPAGSEIQYGDSSSSQTSMPWTASAGASGSKDTWQGQSSGDRRNSLQLAINRDSQFASNYPGSSSQNLSQSYPTYPGLYGDDGRPSMPYPSMAGHPPNLYINPWQVSGGGKPNPIEDNSVTEPSTPLQTLSPGQPPLSPFNALTTKSTLNFRSQQLRSPDNMRPDSSTSYEPDSWESLSGDEEPLTSIEQRLTAEDMADEDELAELREIEMGGSSRRAERRRMRNKLAQRAFRARAKVSKKDVATRLVEAEASNTSQNKELNLLRMMVTTLQSENTQLKRRMEETSDDRAKAGGLSEGERTVRGQDYTGKGKGKERKRSRS